MGWCRTEWDDDVQIDSPEKASWESSHSALVPLPRRPTQPEDDSSRPARLIMARPTLKRFNGNNTNDDSLSFSSTELSEYSDSSGSAGPVTLRRLIALLDDINEA